MPKCITKSVSTCVLLVLSAIALNSRAQSSKASDSVVYEFKPQSQTWVVPQNVHKVKVIAWGAQGGTGNGGKGGFVQSEMDVTPGEKLFIHTGGEPQGPTGGYNGGGDGCGNGTGGGGATDIRIGGDELSFRVLVAGGGGGKGYGGYGGAGGGLNAGQGKYDDTTGYHFAKGGTQEAGGAGARAYFSKPGELGKGGQGINSRGNCTNDAMAGGGGGYYGGGGGGAGGGGGGSSYTNERNHNVIHKQGAREGNGKVVIYW